MRFHQLLNDGAMRRPDRTALWCPDRDEAWTWAEAATRMERAAGALHALGVRRGDRVGIFCANRLDYALTMFGAWRIGAISTHLSVQFGEQLDYYVNDATPDVLVFAAENAARVARLCETLAAPPKHLVCLDGRTDVVPAALAWSELLAAAPAAPPDTVRDEDGAHLSWTSGSTGRPKGALIGHGTTMRACRAIAERLRLRASDVTLGPTSLSSSYHLVANLLPGLFAQAQVGMMASWNAVQARDEMEDLGVSVAPSNATLLAELLEQCRSRGRAPRALRLVLTGGVPTPPSLKRAWRDEFRITLAESYGQSELGGFVGLGYPDLPPDAKLLASGPSLPDREVRVVDAQGTPLACGETGEIEVTGGHMLGYWGRPEQTAAVVRDGWLRTGDLGYLDEDGYVHMRGRASETLVVAGEPWFTRDVEDALLEHRAVLLAALVGAPDAVLGTRPVAWVTLRHGAHADAAELARHAATRLGRDPRLVEVRILDDMPLTPTSKIDKMALRQRAASGTA